MLSMFKKSTPDAVEEVQPPDGFVPLPSPVRRSILLHLPLGTMGAVAYRPADGRQIGPVSALHLLSAEAAESARRNHLDFVDPVPPPSHRIDLDPIDVRLDSTPEKQVAMVEVAANAELDRWYVTHDGECWRRPDPTPERVPPGAHVVDDERPEDGVPLGRSAVKAIVRAHLKFDDSRVYLDAFYRPDDGKLVATTLASDPDVDLAKCVRLWTQSPVDADDLKRVRILSDGTVAWLPVPDLDGDAA